MGERLVIKFQDEEGVDAGGLRREWFDRIGKAVHAAAERCDTPDADGYKGQFMLSPDRTVAPRPCGENYEPDFKELFALGRLAALAIWFDIPLPLPFSRICCKFLLGVPVGPVDVHQLDADFYDHRVKSILERGALAKLEDIGLPLSFESASSACRPPKDLCPGGAERRVTEENKEEYIQLLCEHYLCEGMREQIKVMLHGFWDIFPKDLLVCVGLNHRELALLMCGTPDLDARTWRENSRKSGDFPEAHDMFWQVIHDMTAEER